MLKMTAGLSTLILLALGVPASASGQTAPLSFPDRGFPSPQACRAFLAAQYALAQASADPAPIANDDGSTIQHLLHSDGVIVDGNIARLDTHLGTEVRVLLPDIGQIRTSYSYQERSLACTGATLGEQALSGYSLEGYAPIP